MSKGTRKFHRAFVAALAIVALTLTACAQQPAAPTQAPTQAAPAQEKPQQATEKLERTKLRVGTSAATPLDLNFYVAEDLKFWDEIGLEIEFFVFKGGAEGVKALILGEVDVMSASVSSVLDATSQGQNIRAFWMGRNQPIFDFYSKKYNSFKELPKNAVVGITSFGGLVDFLTRAALRKQGIDPDNDVRIIQAGTVAGRVAALDQGSLDMTILFGPQAYKAQDLGIKRILTQAEGVAVDWPNDAWVSSVDFLDKNPNVIKALLRGAAKGLHYAKANREEAIKILAKHMATEEKYAAMSYDDMMKQNGILEDGRLPGPGLDVFFDSMIQAGDLKAVPPLDSWWYSKYQETYDQWK